MAIVSTDTGMHDGKSYSAQNKWKLFITNLDAFKKNQ